VSVLTDSIDARPGALSPADAVRRASAVLVPLISIGVLAAGNGGFFPPAWGWSATALLWVAAIALLLGDELMISRSEWIVLGALCMLGSWMLVSQLWEGGAQEPVLEAERTLVYVAGVLAFALVTRRGHVRPLLLGTLEAILAACVFGLMGRIAPGSVLAGGASDIGRMSQPIGYWNGLGVFATLGILVAAGVLAHSVSRTARLLAAGALPVLCCTLYFTYSRGGWIALAVGLVVAFVYDRRRGMLLVALTASLPASAAVTLVAASSSALTHAGSPLPAAARQGHRLGLVLLGAIAAQLLVAVLVESVDARWRPSRALTRTGYAVSCGALAAVFVTACVVWTPTGIVSHAYNGFTGRARGGFTAHNGQSGRDLNLRLFSLSGNSRARLWRVAWDDVRSHPWLGSGAGSYERVYLAHRTTSLKVSDAHSLYLETLAELGPVGLALLLIALGVPFVAGAANRVHPLIPAAAGGYAAFVVHAGVDWDWELPAVVLAALALGVALMRAGPYGGAAIGRRSRMALLGAIAVLGFCAVVGLRGNLALSGSEAAAATGHWHSALTQARTAVKWAPWSTDAWVALGDARYAAGQPGGASAYRHAVRLDPGAWAAWLAIARTNAGRAGAHALARAERLDPRGTEVLMVAQLRNSR
jgi:O-antigen ligase